jgi:hypothetical protein
MSKLPVFNYEVVAEQWRLYAYLGFWFFVAFAYTVTRLFTVDYLNAGPAPDTPANRMGCGPFHFGVSSVFLSCTHHALGFHKKQEHSRVDSHFNSILHLI